MLVLALDTSSPATSCALVELGSGRAKVLAEELTLPPVKAGDVLPDILQTLCTQAGRGFADVSALAVGLGPGSFTGLRVGLASAKGLAYARRWPLVGASSLHALALGAVRSLKLEDAIVVPALEARRGELFLCAFAVRGGSLTSISEERVLLAREVAEFLAQLANGASAARAEGLPILLVGAGAGKNLEALRAGGVVEAQLAHAAEAIHPSAAALVELCAGRLREAKFDPMALFALEPLYLAQSEAEKALAAGRVGKLP
jgi:tRNA threonylcarbamoyladenosine biosynthesis protein TsaB